MIGRIIRQLRAAGLSEVAAELDVAVCRARFGQTAAVSPETERAVVQALRRCGRFAPHRDVRTRGPRILVMQKMNERER